MFVWEDDWCDRTWIIDKKLQKKILNIEKQFEKYFSRTRNMNIMLKLEVDRSDTNNIRFQVFV